MHKVLCIQHSINIVEKTSRSLLIYIGNPLNSDLDKSSTEQIIKKFKIHSSILKIKESFVIKDIFDFQVASAENINPDGGPFQIETSPLICSSNQWTGFYMKGISVMKEFSFMKMGVTHIW